MLIDKKGAIKTSVLVLTTIISISLSPSSRLQLPIVAISKKGPQSTTGKGRITKDSSNLNYYRLSDSPFNSPMQNRLNQENVPGENKPKDNTVETSESYELSVGKPKKSSRYKDKTRKTKLYRSSDRKIFNISHQTHLIPGEQLIIIDPKKYAPFFKPYPSPENKKHRRITK